MTIIPAATTPTANTNTEPTEINSVQDLLEQLKCIHEYPQQADLRYWFRGQPNSAHLLLPGVYRKKFVPGAAPSKTTPDPLPHERLTKERLMSKEFAIRSASMVDKKLEDVELYFLQQHYGMPTRLLDWTANPLVGLFFATKSSTEKFAVDCPGIDQALFREDETDGKLFSVDANGFQANPFAAEVNFRGTASKRNPLLREAIKHVFDWGGGDTKFPNFIFPVVPDFFDRRITLQRGCFTFHVPDHIELTITENKTLKSFLIPKNSKSEIRKELRQLGIDVSSIYGDLPSLAEFLKELEY